MRRLTWLACMAIVGLFWYGVILFVRYAMTLI